MRTRFSPNASAWLAAAACVGAGQQIFVVLRNQYLVALTLSPRDVSTVQAAGGAAGIAAGLVGATILGRLRARTTLAIGVLANACGFSLQVMGTRVAIFVAGAALAGFGIQWLTMAAAPFLVRSSRPDERARLFAFNALLVQSLPGALGALLGGFAQQRAAALTGSAVAGHRWALGLGAAAVALALAPLARVRAEPLGVAPRSQLPTGAFRLLAPDALSFFGSGLTIPFLQLYFGARFGMTPAAIGSAYGAMMLAGGAAHLTAPWVARRWGAPALILGAQLASLPLWLALLFARTPSVALVAFVLRHALLGMSAPQYASWIHSSVPPERSDAVAAHRMLVQSIAWAAANFAAGFLLEWRPDFSAVIAATVIAQTLAFVATGVVLTRSGS